MKTNTDEFTDPILFNCIAVILNPLEADGVVVTGTVHLLSVAYFLCLQPQGDNSDKQT